MRGRALLLLVIGCLCAGAFAGSAQAEYGAVSEFAGNGSGDGQLGSAGDAAVEQSTGNLFVVDPANNRVQVFATSGDSATYLTQFGSGLLSSPFSVAVYESGGQTTVYVSDAGNNRVVKFESDEQATPGFTLAAGYTSPPQGSEEGQISDFRAPLAMAPGGNLWVGDRPTGRVMAFDPTGAYVPGSSFDGSSSPDDVFGGILDIAVDSSGDLIVNSSPLGNPEYLNFTPSRVERFDPAGNFLDLIVKAESYGPGAVAVDPATDDVFVANNLVGFKNPPAKIQLYDATGTLLDEGDLPVYEGEFEPGPIVPGLAAAAGTGRAYAIARYGFFGDTKKGFVLREVARPVVAVDPIADEDITSTGAEVTGTVDPNGLQTNYHFEYRRKGDTAWTLLPEGDAGSGSGPVPVSVVISGLQPGRAYQVRLLAVNSDRPATSSQKEFVTLFEQPIAETKSAIEVGDVSARLRGTVDPRGGATTYYFEFGPTTAYGQQVPQPPASANPSGPTQVSELVTGLQPGTTYHYRLVAVNQQGTAPGEDQTFTTAGAAPQVRGFEKVTPGGKNGYDVLVELFGGVFLPESVRMSASGSLVGFQSSGGFADAETTNTSNEYSARKTASGWVTHAYAPKGYGSAFSGGATILGWADDGESGILALGGNGPQMTPDSTPGVPNLYRVDTATKELETITVDPGFVVEGFNPVTSFVGGSSDFSKIFFEDTIPRTDGAPASPSRNLYEWSGGEPKLAAILPDDTLAVGAGIGDAAGNADNAVSDDGSRVFFTAGGTVYMREDGATTIPVSASQKVSPDAPQPATYWTASTDGRFAFFTTAEQLLETDADEFNDLYRYDVETDQLIRVNAGTTNPEYAGVTNVAGASADGSYVYFVDLRREAELAYGLYVWHDGSIDFVADLEFSAESTQLRDGGTVRVSADGTGIVFLTSSAQPRPGMSQTSGTSQVYVYDAETDELNCASCRDDGSLPAESALLPGGWSIGGRGTLFPAGKPRSISENGSRVFFTSADPLVPADGNGKRDAYEAVNGEPRLLSTGQNPYASYFLDADPSGTGALVGTREKLTPSDKDSNYDVYNARFGVAAEGSSGPPPCNGDGCQGALPAPPADPTIGTASVGSPGPGGRCASLRARAAAKRRAAADAKPKQAKSLKKQARRLQKQVKRCNRGTGS